MFSFLVVNILFDITVSGGVSSTPGKSESGGYSPPLVRITLASLDECHNLLQNGLDFYGATFFPTEPGPNNALLKVINKKSPHYLSRYVVQEYIFF